MDTTRLYDQTDVNASAVVQTVQETVREANPVEAAICASMSLQMALLRAPVKHREHLRAALDAVGLAATDMLADPAFTGKLARERDAA